MGKKRQKVNWVTVDGLHWTGTEEVGDNKIVTFTSVPSLLYTHFPVFSY